MMGKFNSNSITITITIKIHIHTYMYINKKQFNLMIFFVILQIIEDKFDEHIQHDDIE